jgi:hypothetical protein
MAMVQKVKTRPVDNGKSVVCACFFHCRRSIDRTEVSCVRFIVGSCAFCCIKAARSFEFSPLLGYKFFHIHFVRSILVIPVDCWVKVYSLDQSSRIYGLLLGLVCIDFVEFRQIFVHFPWPVKTAQKSGFFLITPHHFALTSSQVRSYIIKKV